MDFNKGAARHDLMRRALPVTACLEGHSRTVPLRSVPRGSVVSDARAGGQCAARDRCGA
jgi:hypothetical protein